MIFSLTNFLKLKIHMKLLKPDLANEHSIEILIYKVPYSISKS